MTGLPNVSPLRAGTVNVGLASRIFGRIEHAGSIGAVIQGRINVFETFSDFVYLFTEADSPEQNIEEVPSGVAAAVDGMLAVPVATDASPLRVSLEWHDREPPPLTTADGEDVAILTWHPLGRRLRLGDTAGHEVDGFVLGAGDEVLAVEVRCRNRDEASRAGVADIEEILIRLWPGPAPGHSVSSRSGYARALAGAPPPSGGPRAPLPLGATVPMPVYYNGFYLHDEGLAVPSQWRETMALSSARVNGLVSNLPGLVRVSTGTQTGQVDLCVRVVGGQPAAAADALSAAADGLPATADAVAVTHRTSGTILIADTEDNADHYRITVPAGDVGLLVVAWDRDKAAQRRNARARERVDLVFWAGDTPDEMIIQAASVFGRETAADDQRIRQQLEEE